MCCKFWVSILCIHLSHSKHKLRACVNDMPYAYGDVHCKRYSVGQLHIQKRVNLAAVKIHCVQINWQCYGIAVTSMIVLQLRSKSK